MKKTILILVLTTIAYYLNAQENSRKYDIKLGSGFGYMTNVAINTFNIEGDFNYKINKYFTAGFNLNSSGGNNSKNGYFSNNSFIAKNSTFAAANIFISPFGNNKYNNFKIGTGLAFILQTTSSFVDPRNIIINEPENTIGINLIVEDEQIIFSRFLIGGKLYINKNLNNSTLIGALVKIGYIF